MAIDNWRRREDGGDGGGKRRRGQTMARTDDGEGEHRESEIRKTAAAQRAREVVRWSNRSTQRKRKENGQQLPTEARKRERMGRWAAVVCPLTKPGAEIFIRRARLIQNECSTRKGK